MLTDGLTQRQERAAGTDVEILDVSQLLLAAVTRGDTAPPDEVDALGAGAPGVETTPLSGTQVNGAGPSSAVTADPAGDVAVGGAGTGGASPRGANPNPTGPDADPPR